MKEINELLDFINSCSCNYDAIVVEGYDGVGKGTILNKISASIGVEPYRPDYNLWQKYDHRMKDRWKVSGFFWDIFSHFHNSSGACAMLFDRGVLSGAVYGNDMKIARDYKKLLRDMRVLHILVITDENSFRRFQKNRFPNIDEYELDKMWEEYLVYEWRYYDSLKVSGVEYIVYTNLYDEMISESSSDTCEGCGHYNYGYCRHPDKNCKVDPTSKRCEISGELEVQDRDGAEMLSV